MDPSIAVYITASSSQSLVCYFPGYMTSSTNVNLVVNLHKKKDNYFHRYVPNDYWSKFKIEGVSEGYITSGTVGSFTVAYPSAYWSTNVKSYSATNFDVTLTSSSSIPNPTVYLSMYGPKPVNSYCSSGFS